jgi:hypothetical protein
VAAPGGLRRGVRGAGGRSCGGKPKKIRRILSVAAGVEMCVSMDLRSLQKRGLAGVIHPTPPSSSRW